MGSNPGPSPSVTHRRLHKLIGERPRPQPQRVALARALVAEPGVDDILREYVAFGEKGMILFQRLQGGLQRRRTTRDLGQLFRR